MTTMIFRLLWQAWMFLKIYILSVWLLLIQLLTKRNKAKDLTVKDGCVAVVTGGASGIGRKVTEKLACHGVTVVIASRDKEEAETCISEIEIKGLSNVLWIHLDLADFDSIQKFANEFHKLKLPLDILINNGTHLAFQRGKGHQPFPQKCCYDDAVFPNKQGVELQFGTNYLGHVLLTSLLLDKLRASGTGTHFSRIVNISSHVHYAGELGNLYDTINGSWYSAHASYAQSKLALVMWTYFLNRTFQRFGNHATCNAVHPGIVNTNLYQHVHWSIQIILRPVAKYLFLSPEEAANGVVYAALSQELEARGGLYLDNCKCIRSSRSSYNVDDQWLLWTWTKDFIKSLHEFLEGDFPEGFDR